MYENEENRSGSKRRVIIVIFLIVQALLILLAALVLRYSPQSGKDASDGSPERIAPGLDPNAGEYAEPAKLEAAKGVAIPGWSEIYIPSDQTEVEVDFYNPEENGNMYFLTFELKIPDGSEDGYETLYHSGLVPAGLHIQNITLSHGLEAGVYDAVIHVQPYDADSVATNNADLETKLIVE